MRTLRAIVAINLMLLFNVPKIFKIIIKCTWYVYVGVPSAFLSVALYGQQRAFLKLF